jgi:class 3 adenylate cyclase
VSEYRVLATVPSTDIVDSTRLAAAIGDVTNECEVRGAHELKGVPGEVRLFGMASGWW